VFGHCDRFKETQKKIGKPWTNIAVHEPDTSIYVLLRNSLLTISMTLLDLNQQRKYIF
jgi:hypothetical protein